MILHTTRPIIFLLILFPFCSSVYGQEVEIQASGQIKNVKDPVDPQDAVTKAYLEAYVDQILLSFGIPLGSAGIQGLLNAGICPLDIVAAGAHPDSLMGKMYQGGLIFYLDDQDTIPGMKGLVAAPQDQDYQGDFSIPWHCNGTDLPIPNVTSGPSGEGAEIGDGATNTVGIDTASCSVPGDAAVICANLSLSEYEDWFLPSAKELNEMYQKIGKGAATPNTNIGGFADIWYWSSSEVEAFIAWAQQFNDGTQSGGIKNDDYRVRAVRAF